MHAIHLTRSTEGLFEMNHTKVLAVCLGLFSLLMTGVGADLECRAIKAINTTTSYQAGPGMYGMAADDGKEAKIEIVRDRFLMFLGCGASFGGAVVCVILRRVWAKEETDKTRQIMAAHFTVSFISAIFCIPAALKYYFKTDTPEMMFLCAFLGALVVWGIWEIVFAMIARIKKAAIDRGIAGVKDEITGGNTQVVTSVPAKPTAVPQVPVGDKTS